MAARTIVVAGASLAGLRAASTLRGEGFAGRLVMVGAEPHLPYDRPPLSKQVLAGAKPPESTRLRGVDDLDAEWELGVPAAALDPVGRRVELADGRALTYDGLVIATGASARSLPGGAEADRRPPAGLHVLRSLEDCLGLAADLDAGPGRVVVIGAGFIGAEVAATARSRGLAVTVVEPLAAPVVRGLGERLGGVVADLHRDHGVDLRLSTRVVGVQPAGDGRVGRVLVEEAGGVGRIEADVVVAGIGAVPATGWLAGSGLALDDGVVADATCLVAPGVVAAGDVARWYHEGYGEHVRLEHWDNATTQGPHAARTLLADLAGGRGEPFTPVPYVWSDQYDRKIQVLGRPRADAAVAVVEGSVAERRFLALYGHAGKVVAAVGMNMPARLMRWAEPLARGAPWDDALRAGGG